MFPWGRCTPLEEPLRILEDARTGYKWERRWNLFYRFADVTKFLFPKEYFVVDWIYFHIYIGHYFIFKIILVQYVLYLCLAWNSPMYSYAYLTENETRSTYFLSILGRKRDVVNYAHDCTFFLVAFPSIFTRQRRPDIRCLFIYIRSSASCYHIKVNCFPIFLDQGHNPVSVHIPE